MHRADFRYDDFSEATLLVQFPALMRSCQNYSKMFRIREVHREVPRRICTTGRNILCLDRSVWYQISQSQARSERLQVKQQLRCSQRRFARLSPGILGTADNQQLTPQCGRHTRPHPTAHTPHSRDHDALLTDRRLLPHRALPVPCRLRLYPRSRGAQDRSRQRLRNVRVVTSTIHPIIHFPGSR